MKRNKAEMPEIGEMKNVEMRSTSTRGEIIATCFKVNADAADETNLEGRVECFDLHLKNIFT